MMRVAIIVTIILSNILIANCQSTPSWLPKKGLIAWYPFNGNANDESGNGNDGIVLGAALTTDRDNAANSAYEFLDLTKRIATETYSEKYISITAWIYCSDLSPDYESIVGKWGGPSGKFSFELSKRLNDHVGLVVSTDGTNIISIESSNPIPINKWVHVAGTYDGGYLRIFVDGVFEDSVNAPGNIFNTTDTIYIGATRNGIDPNSWPWYGKLDDISIYNRALTPDEIFNIYNTSCPALTATEPVNLSIKKDSSATFYVSPAISQVKFEWQQDAGTGFQSLSNAGVYSGTDSDTLKISIASINMDNYKYRCILSIDTYCPDTTNSATLTVINNVGLVPVSRSNIKVYPNPSSGKFQLAGIDFTEVNEAVFVDMLGKEQRHIIAENGVFECSECEPGIYQIQLLKNGKPFLDNFKVMIDY